MTDASVLRRRRAASIAGRARISQADPDELDATRRRGGEARAEQTRGNSSWGKFLAEKKRMKRYGLLAAPPSSRDLEARIAALEATLGKATTGAA